MAEKAKKASKAAGDGRMVRDVMTGKPEAMLSISTVAEAAKTMRDNDIGDVIVLDETTGRLCGIVTDRDIVVRAVADETDPKRTTLGTICSRELVTLTPEDGVEDAVNLMRKNAVRRLVVVESDKPVGIVSL